MIADPRLDSGQNGFVGYPQTLSAAPSVPADNDYPAKFRIGLSHGYPAICLRGAARAAVLKISPPSSEKRDLS